MTVAMRKAIKLRRAYRDLDRANRERVRLARECMVLRQKLSGFKHTWQRMEDEMAYIKTLMHWDGK
jgi:hypothetical protein